MVAAVVAVAETRFYRPLQTSVTGWADWVEIVRIPRFSVQIVESGYCCPRGVGAEMGNSDGSFSFVDRASACRGCGTAGCRNCFGVGGGRRRVCDGGLRRYPQLARGDVDVALHGGRARHRVPRGERVSRREQALRPVGPPRSGSRLGGHLREPCDQLVGREEVASGGSQVGRPVTGSSGPAVHGGQKS